jgi:hypothetical protein
MIVKCFATLLALLATAATWYATWDCHFFTITDTVSPQQAGNSSNLTLAHSYGLLLVQGTGVDVIESLHTVVNGTDHFVRSSAACVTYGNFHEVVNSFSNFDSYLWAGTAFGVLALVFSFPVFFLSLAPCCLGRNALNGLACSAFVLAIFTALEFVSILIHSSLYYARVVLPGAHSALLNVEKLHSCRFIPIFAPKPFPVTSPSLERSPLVRPVPGSLSYRSPSVQLPSMMQRIRRVSIALYSENA